MKISIIGTGVIGGSIGLSALDRGLVDEVVGYDTDARSLQTALDMSALTKASKTAEEAVRSADIVFIATPVSEVASVFKTIVPGLEESVIVSDVGSTKKRIVEEIGQIDSKSTFIGGHPIAGSEREGIGGAQPDLFEGCYWVLTPVLADEHAYSTLASFVSALGAEVISLEPQHHDELVALTSHLPQIVASVLMRYAHEEAPERAGIPLIAAGGFKDMTRIAASSTDLWMDILKHNRDSLSEVLAGFRDALDSAERFLRDSNWDELRKVFDSARSARRGMQDKPGLASGDLSVVTLLVTDKPGVLSEVTSAVGNVGVNIEDMQITHSSQGGRGTIRLTLSGEGAAELAIKALEKQGYTARRTER